MKHEDLRTPEEIFDDMLADDCSHEEIMMRLGWNYGQVRSRFLNICYKLGEQPDAK